jgi:acetoin utilization protein AcuB
MTYTVSDFMTRNPISVAPDDRLRQAVGTMQANECRRLPVVQDGVLIGIISDRDVRLALVSPFVLRERWYDDAVLDETPVRACMTWDVLAVPPDMPLSQAAALMCDRKIGGLPVVAQGRLVGIITETDMLAALIRLRG